MTLPDLIRSQLDELEVRLERYREREESGELTREERKELYDPSITVTHYGGTVTLTPEQARKVLEGGELVDDAMGVRVL